MTATRRIVLATTAAAALVAAPASASTLPPAWHDAGAAAPANVDFKAVATYAIPGKSDPLVVAVGTAPGAGGAQEAVVYRFVDGTWVQDQLGQTPVAGCLTDVAVTAQAAWAVGTGDSDCSSQRNPIVLRFPGGGAELAKPTDTSGSTGATASPPPQWTPLDQTALAPLGGAAPSALALLGTTGYLGDPTGAIRPIDDSAAAPIGSALAYRPATDQGSLVTLAGVNGIAFTRDPASVADGSKPFGLAVGGSDQAAKPKIFDVGADPAGADGTPSGTDSAQPSTFQPDTGATTVRDVGAALGAPATTPVAIESQALWAPDGNGVWTRQRPSSTFSDSRTDLRGVAVSMDGSGRVTAALAGTSGTASSIGTVWVRHGTSAWPTDTGGWTKYSAPASLTSDFNDVAVAGPDDIWAVGRSGQVVRWSAVTVADSTGDSGSGSGTGSGTGTGTGTVSGSGSGDQTFTSGGVQTTVVQPPASSGTQTRSTRPTAPAAQPRLLRSVRVRVFKGRLLISFRLIAPARVAARAMRNGKLIGRAGARLMRKGHGVLVLRYKGRRPPSQLQLIVSPVPGAGRSG